MQALRRKAMEPIKTDFTSAAKSTTLFFLLPYQRSSWASHACSTGSLRVTTVPLFSSLLR
jgi:hypothetical protein